jgi:hypothetical protein
MPLADTRLAIGDWRLAIGDWRLAIGCQKVKANTHIDNTLMYCIIIFVLAEKFIQRL